LGDYFGHLAPVSPAGDLDMPDFHRNMSFFADTKNLGQRLKYGVALTAHMRGVNAAELRCLCCKSDQFVSFGIRCRSILKRGGYANRALSHPLADQFLHLLELLCGRLNIRISKHHTANLCGSDVRGKVDSDALFFQAREILPERAPIRTDMKMRVLVLVRLNNGII